MTTHHDKVFRFRVSLEGIEPEIWRMIDVPATYDFWALHVAIQDAMGWLDYHLHMFTPVGQGYKPGKMIGIPDEDGEMDVEAGWDVSMTDEFLEPGDAMDYLYDFGDSWLHRVTLTEILSTDPSNAHPRCVDGARACPPEDCGSIPGYYELLEVLTDRRHEDYQDMVHWLRGHPGNYDPYDPERFNPSKVAFSDPDERWDLAFNEE